MSMATMTLKVEDSTGQVRRRARGIPREATVGDFMSGVVRELRLPVNDSEGRPLTYAARANGESLLESDRVGDVLQEEDTVTLTQKRHGGLMCPRRTGCVSCRVVAEHPAAWKPPGQRKKTTRQLAQPVRRQGVSQ